MDVDEDAEAIRRHEGTKTQMWCAAMTLPAGDLRGPLALSARGSSHERTVRDRRGAMSKHGLLKAAQQPRG